MSLEAKQKSIMLEIFFSKTCVFDNLIFPKIALIISTVTATIPYASLEMFFQGLSYSILLEKLSNYFFSLKQLPFSFKNLCFHYFLRCDRNNLINSTISVKKPFGSLEIVP